MSGPKSGKTILPIEWTNQHGCGHGDLNCNIVLQYKCQPTTITEKHRMMRNGMSLYMHDKEAMQRLISFLHALTAKRSFFFNEVYMTN